MNRGTSEKKMLGVFGKASLNTVFFFFIIKCACKWFQDAETTVLGQLI